SQAVVGLGETCSMSNRGGKRRELLPFSRRRVHDRVVLFLPSQGSETAGEVPAGGEDGGVRAKRGRHAARLLVIRRAVKALILPRAGGDGDAAEDKATIRPGEMHAA